MKTKTVSALALAAALALVCPPAHAEISIPQELIQAIARHESALNPYAVNVDGKSYHPANAAEALEIIAAAQAAGQNYDVGLMQVNRWWIEKFNISIESLLDAEINRQWGIWILAQEIERHGYTWLAVGKYHSPDIERGRQYAWRIYENLPATGVTVQNEASPQEESHAD